MRRTGPVTLGFVLFAVSHVATAAVVVTEPTGDADPAFLAELKASLETVAAEAPAELNGELRSSAAITVAGVELAVEYMPFIGAEPIRETRTASRASALAQARGMGRAAIRSLVVPKPVLLPASQQTDVTPSVEPPKPPPPPRERYSRRIALVSSVLPTVIIFASSWAVGFIDYPELLDIATFPALTVFGSFAPTIGYFYLGKWKHALLLSGIRLVLGGVAITSAAIGANDYSAWYETNCVEDEFNPPPSSCDDHDVMSSGEIFGVVFAALLSGVALVDASLVGVAADNANKKWRESKKLEIQAAPMLWSNGHGDGTFGLAVNGTF